MVVTSDHGKDVCLLPANNRIVLSGLEMSCDQHLASIQEMGVLGQTSIMGAFASKMSVRT